MFSFVSFSSSFVLVLVLEHLDEKNEYERQQVENDFISHLIFFTS